MSLFSYDIFSLPEETVDFCQWQVKAAAVALLGLSVYKENLFGVCVQFVAVLLVLVCVCQLSTFTSK